MNRKALLYAGVLLLAVSLLGLIQSARAGVAQQLYRVSKFSNTAEPLGRTLKNCYTAHTLYPYNYYYSIFAAKKAYGRWLSSKNEKHYGISEYWCKEAYAANPYNREVRELTTRLLAKKSPDLAVESWKIYLDWDFWNPYNHAVMAEMHAKAGNFSLAVASLEWIRGTKYYEPARSKVMEEWDYCRVIKADK